MKYEFGLTDASLSKIDHAWILEQLRTRGTPKIKRKLAVRVPDDLRLKDANSALQVRCLKSGARSFVVHTTISGGANRLYTWKGAHEPSYKELKTWAQQKHAEMMAGIDQRAQHKAVVKANEVSKITLRQAIADYRTGGNGSEKTRGDTADRLTRYMAHWLDRPMMSIIPKDLLDLWGENGTALLTKVQQQQKKAKANGNGGNFTDGRTQANATIHSFVTVWSLFQRRYTTHEMRVPDCPSRIAKIELHGIKRRKREFDNDTIKALWAARKLDVRTQCYFKIAALTGLRGVEIRCLEWNPVPDNDVIGGKRGAWVEKNQLVFAANFTKARDTERGEFYIPLTDELRAIFKTLRSLPDAHEQWVFPATGAKHSESGHVESVGWMMERMKDAGVKFAGGAHGIRHHFRNMLRELKYNSEQADAAMNQATMGVGSGYGIRLTAEGHTRLLGRVNKYVERVIAGEKHPAEAI
jgi:integrase